MELEENRPADPALRKSRRPTPWNCRHSVYSRHIDHPMSPGEAAIILPKDLSRLQGGREDSD